MNEIELMGNSGTPYLLMKLLILFIIGAVVVTIGGYYAFLVYILVVVIVYVIYKIKKLEANKRRQRAFMRAVKKKRKVEMLCGRWGDFYYINVFGIDLAADSTEPLEIKEMIVDVIRIIRSLEEDGKLPKGKLYSERVAYLVQELGLDAETCEWLCETEVLSDIDFLIRMGYSREPRNMKEWIEVIQGRAKADGRVVYNSSYIARVINKVEALAEQVQIENIKAGGFKTIA